MHVKICGLTTLDDALRAVEAGADYLGFNFYPASPRYVTDRACERMVAGLRSRAAGVTLVGIFVDTPAAEAARALDACGLDLAQLHGRLEPEALEVLWGRAYPAVRGGAAELAALARFGPGAPAGLVDAVVPGAHGGTGQLADWPAARALAARWPIFLAGGLTPANVAEAVAQVRPWGVDVASGVESAPGKKDAEKMRAFVSQAREAGNRSREIKVVKEQEESGPKGPQGHEGHEAAPGSREALQGP
jgi:phosphoribosylanthranilate isomerase